MTQATDSWPPKKVVCVGAVVKKDGRILWIRQAKGTSLAGQWSIPWGIVEADEQPEEAALRETLEEGGITADIDGLLGYQNFNWQNMFSLIYLCTHKNGTPTHDGNETDRVGYFTLSQLEALGEPIESWSHWIVKRVLAKDFHLIPAINNNPQQPKGAFF